jgi:hypothetical protein
VNSLWRMYVEFGLPTAGLRASRLKVRRYRPPPSHDFVGRVAQQLPWRDRIAHRQEHRIFLGSGTPGRRWNRAARSVARYLSRRALGVGSVRERVHHRQDVPQQRHGKHPYRNSDRFSGPRAMRIPYGRYTSPHLRLNARGAMPPRVDKTPFALTAKGSPRGGPYFQPRCL